MGGAFEPELINTDELSNTVFHLIINEVGRGSPKAYLLVLLTTVLVAGGLLVFRGYFAPHTGKGPAQHSHQKSNQNLLTRCLNVFK